MSTKPGQAQRRHYGKRHALCVSSATTGLQGLALALDLRGAEFVTTPYTYGATVAGWMLHGATPVFADIDPVTLTLDPDTADRAITPRTRALLAVDIFGVPCDDDRLRAVADRHGLWFVVDASQSFGAVRAGRPAGVCAHALVLSFTAGKALDAGEGGAVLTDDDQLYERLVWFTQHPERQRRELGLPVWNEFGLNGRIHPLAAEAALTGFGDALQRVLERQAWAAGVLDFLNQTGLIEPLDYVGLGLAPSFWRLTVARTGRTCASDIQRSLSTSGHRVEVSPPPVSLLYRHPALLSRRDERLLMGCGVAEHQARSRVAILPCASGARRGRASNGGTIR